MTEQPDGPYLVPQFVADEIARRIAIADDRAVYLLLGWDKVDWRAEAERRSREARRISNRLRTARRDWAMRIELAIEALRGRHECGYE